MNSKNLWHFCYDPLFLSPFPAQLNKSSTRGGRGYEPRAPSPSSFQLSTTASQFNRSLEFLTLPLPNSKLHKLYSNLKQLRILRLLFSTEPQLIHKSSILHAWQTDNTVLNCPNHSSSTEHRVDASRSKMRRPNSPSLYTPAHKAECHFKRSRSLFLPHPRNTATEVFPGWWWTGEPKSSEALPKGPEFTQEVLIITMYF